MAENVKCFFARALKKDIYSLKVLAILGLWGYD
jgi:hypothetical protein